MRYVLIRDNMAGVFAGILQARKGKSWTITNSRKIHYWTAAAATEGIASYGPGSGSRVCPLRVLPASGEDLIQILDLTEAEYQVILAYPEWKP